jgi:hypothetical protein
MSGQTPPGWYRDPYGAPGLLRYWDGGQWTQATRPADEEPPAPPWQAGGGQEASPWPPRDPQPSSWSPESWPAKRSNKGLIWALVGGGAALVAAVLVVSLFASGAFKDEAKPTPSPTSNANGRSPITGTVDDAQAGVSFARLGGGWTTTALGSSDGFNSLYGFTWAEVAVVQQKYDGTQNYYANAYSGRLPTSIAYSGIEDLSRAATTLARSVESAPEPRGAYPSHTRRDLEERAYTVSGKNAWYIKFQVIFPQAQSRGWNFRTETAVLILIDQGSGNRPSTFFVSVPDSHPNGGDLRQLVESIKTR